MPLATRRAFLEASLGGVGGLVCAETALAGPGTTARQRVPMIHGTDLFRPHIDPDDHWDLACVFALAHRGDVDLLGVLIDFPVPGRRNDPDVQAVAQLNYLTGKTVPVMIGMPRRLEAEEAKGPAHEAETRGIRAVLDLLRRWPRPVVLNVVGSCRDVATAGRMEPELFARKCAAIYLNAGSGTPDRAKAARLEYNVALDPPAYASLFQLPCPIYWMPCFEVVPGRDEPWQSGDFGTFYRFRQGEVLPELSPGVQNYFAYVFQDHQEGKTQVGRADWLRFLLAPQDKEIERSVRAMDRSMWCTGGFLHAAGLSVTCEGKIVPLAEVRDPVFTFDPIEVTCSADGVTQWRAASTPSRRFLFHVRDPIRYPAAMTAALRSLLKALP